MALSPGKRDHTHEHASAPKRPKNYAAKQLGNGAVSGDTLVDRFEKLERDEKIERLLGELKQKQGRMLEAG